MPTNTSPRITFIGAGSVVFTKNLLGDILSFPELAESQIALMDIDEERLRTAKRVAEKVADAVGARPKITAHTNRREAIEGANYVIDTIQVGGYEPATVTDFEIPKKYGLRQTIADTLGIGGIMRGLRTIPVVNGIAADIREVGAPRCQFLNYTNPMAMLCWAVDRAEPTVPTVGLCHSVQGTAHQLAHDIGVPQDEISYLCAGINHVAFYLRFERKGSGEDLYPLIRKVAKEGRIPDWNRVRYEMLERLGYFVTESSEHFSEYCPHFIRRDEPELIDRFNVPLDEYIRRCIDQIGSWEKMRGELEGDQPIKVHRSMEYGSLIIHSMETNIPRVIYGNVPNRGLIDNLPEGCCVEVPCLVDSMGVQPTPIGALPPQLAAMMQTNINVQSLTVEAALTGKREHIYQAAMFDPHTAAELSLDQIWSMVDDLIEAH
ncbi:MAG: alpha-glucosidase/alpha-galactosidase, partial [Chloroflexi bacterium]|nr:alpha-glucosidase/alpha-galactosidase [Chloroflexota bacterium]